MKDDNPGERLSDPLSADTRPEPVSADAASAEHGNHRRQGSMEWRQARLGMVTASAFHSVLSEASPKGLFQITGERGDWFVVSEGQIPENFSTKAAAEEKKSELIADWRKTHWSATAQSYCNLKLAEMLYGQPSDIYKSDALEWGKEHETYAFEACLPVICERYGDDLSLPVDDLAFIHSEHEGIGCSPDGIVGENGLLEIKCPYSPGKWIAAYRANEAGTWTMPTEHRAQVQGSLWVTGRSWYAFAYYDHRVEGCGIDPLLILRVPRDHEYIDNVLAPRILALRD